MTLIESLRQYRFSGYAIFDLTVAFFGIYLLSPFLSKIFLKFRLNIPRKSWLFLTLPISIVTHLLVGNLTQMTKDFINLHDHYILKLVIFCLLIGGIRGIKIINNNRQ